MRTLWMIPVLWGCPSPDEPRTCDLVEAEFGAERTRIQECTEAVECGQVLTGTSCGCTRDWVARIDADVTVFYDLLEEVGELECDVGASSVCDCPPTAGFLCDAGTCAHNYVDAYPYLPDCRADEGDDLQIDAAALDGDELVVTVAYGGGCEEHDITLCWPDQVFAESEPVQASLELFHDDHDDACDAWLVEDRRFDLAPLRQAWKDGYGGGGGTITVHVGGASLTYTFE